MRAAVSYYGPMEKEPHISVIVPVYNEEKNIPLLFSRLASVMNALPVSYEIIAVDDGSGDASFDALMRVASKDSHVNVIRFKRNFGQTAALAAGIDHARGDTIVTIDSDLENDPADIPRLLEKIDEGYEVVSGWRQGRWAGALFTRRLPSIVANMIISAVTGVSLHDYGCTLKAYRSDVIKGVKLYGEMHRFIPAYAAWQGGRVAEIPVTHSPRKHGKSNYGFGRVFRVLLDLVVVVFMHRYMNRPMHFFGMWGLASLSFGFLVGCIAITLRIFVGLHLIDTPLPVLTALLIIVGIQLVLFGVIGEMIMRTYYESQNRRPYTIKESTIEH
ncbi:MAG: Glycosyl transferase family 2 [Candidatus Kaiserbacteria bacterium GW2011_GWB1_52_6]|uniref:Glycosyl transferase family 2 n=2 Tax=Candidatus Kaiseribacteriota TaxID=1752734 RepID=A0A0G2AED2_9BACT|nr:MAG: Glycosyl transferase family 2 [Candidatus Kaiserbacteria bacterium GW2011_GWB1_52_6]KKW30824.1 MAG: Glycosyl transferase family 2 [Candidatus Kaiserbacteria bacterium GW2011_GWC2_52_8b]